ncbi:hypothetical protein D0Z07_4562 [Hyphodiscus hymeniophilus]|uniref:Uncharacterized protein n=1 Tax=Hyphodiscus hymeniophilus TaxID=353542 RepID=A0A9P6VKY5_9HELO|nr:hypothetical protein D0Z07_4562 [Hyphodiscus hymeniophilus]
MLSVASLLNPVKPEMRGTPQPTNSSPSLMSPSHGSPMLSSTSIKKQKMTKDGAVFAKGRVKGEVRFAPFEQFDAGTTREVQRFEVYPLGKIQEYSRHIPYNSEKKNFLEKTGRESFEVFQYIFKVPGDDKDYTVMWDYNVGLVRITPFFKCYHTSQDAKLESWSQRDHAQHHRRGSGSTRILDALLLRPRRLHNILLTHSRRSDPHLRALISIPMRAPEAPEHGRMIIDPSIVAQATAEAEAFRVQYTSFTPKSTPRGSYSPQAGKIDSFDNMSMRTTPPSSLSRRLRLKRTRGGDNPYGTPTDTDMENGSETSSADGYFCSPGTPSTLSRQHSWGPRNIMSHSANSSINISPVKGPNPWLSAIPRSTGLVDIPMTGTWRGKRCAEETDADDEYDGDEGTDDKKSLDVDKGNDREMEDVGAIGGAEKKAAFLLMNLSVKDGESCTESARAVADQEDQLEGPRVKRRRATSM